MFRFVAIVILSLCVAAGADAGTTKQSQFFESLDRMIVELAPQSAHASLTIRQAYRDHLQLLVLDRLSDRELALSNGGLAPLPPDPTRFNLKPRLDGPFPIGEKDLDNQRSYIASRPATIGCLLDIASRVKSGPVEVTSLVRHSEYQGALKTTNPNATTSIPMHTLGLAFDIALVNSRLETIYEIRNVLEDMRDAGDILFIAERKQLVFHVVPHPLRLGHFTDVYTRVIGAPPSTTGQHLVAVSQSRVKKGRKVVPAVSAEVVAVLPTGEYADEWWAADDAHADVSIQVSGTLAPAPAPAPIAASSAVRVIGGQLLAAIGTLIVFAWRLITHRPLVRAIRL
jgi:hypothetical protein